MPHRGSLMNRLCAHTPATVWAVHRRSHSAMVLVCSASTKVVVPPMYHMPCSPVLSATKSVSHAAGLLVVGLEVVGSEVVGETEGEVVGSEVVGEIEGEVVGPEVVGELLLASHTE